MHDPEIVYLDEPTIGLDVVSKAAVRDFLEAVNRDRGVTVLLTTHDLADVERLCSRLVVVDAGRIIHDGTVGEIKSRFGDHRTVVVDLEEAGPPLEVAGAEVTAMEGPRQWLRFDRGFTTAAAVVTAVANQAGLRDIAIEEPNIEDVVARIYRREEKDRPASP